MTARDSDLLDAIICRLMQSPAQCGPLQIAIGLIAIHVLEQPDWLPGLPPQDRAVIENVLLLAAGPNDGPRH